MCALESLGKPPRVGVKNNHRKDHDEEVMTVDGVDLDQHGKRQEPALSVYLTHDL